MTFYPVNMNLKPEVTGFFDPDTNTISYVVKDPSSSACAVIDSVMDIDYAAGRIAYKHADSLIDFITKQNLTLEWIIETHVHADHLSAAPYLQQKLGGKIGVGERFLSYRIPLERFLTKGRSFSVMVRSSMLCLKMATAMK